MAKLGSGAGTGMQGLARGTKALGAIPVPIILKAALAIGVLGAALIPLSYALSLLAPLIESMGKAIGSVLTGLAPTIKAFGTVIESMGKAIASVFDSIGGVIESVGTSIASVMDSITRMKVGKINAEADAMVKTTEASVNAIERLQHLDPSKVMGLAMGVDALCSSLGNFADNMNPTLLDSLKGGMAALFGQDSPVEQVLALSQNADPVKIMDLAKATMATTAANAGATSLDPSLSSGSTTTITNNDGTTTTTTNVAPASNDDLLEALGVMSAQNVTQSEIMRKTNKLLTEISGKT
jgi:phage-related protein